MSEMILQAQGLCKSYGKKPVLYNVDLKIDKGDIYGLVGKNGAGKTTLMRIMTGLQVPTAGTIEYGFDRRRLGSVGALVELPSIYANKSAYENMKFQYLNLGLPADGSIHDILRLVGLDNTGNKKAGKFSLGMRQRLGIAIAMVGDPEVLILDEPINGLDPQGIIGIRDLLLKLNREKGITIIISSHILSELSKLATRFAFIDDGRIIRECSAYDIENAGEKLMIISADRPSDLSVVLNTKGYRSETVSNPDKVTIHGEVDITDVVLLARDEGIKITDLKTVETDLEDFYVGIVGGNRNAAASQI
ncbi:MAG: ATP-binding cassette domain-containing protein [Clostridiales bacterium]|nr:ATP-binding cassette domain-containing protein [Clostridiales bacterium]